MIRPLTAADLPVAVALLMRDPAHNLYMLGNLETLGLGDPICAFWGDFGQHGAPGSLRGLANRYMVNWGVYGAADADWPALAGLLDADAGAARLQDNPGGVPSLLPLLARHRAARVEEEELVQLDAADFRPQPAPPGVEVRRATLDDLPELVALYRDAGSMSRSPLGVERPLRDTQVWVALRDGRIAAAALTNAETGALAMVGGVYTPPFQRGRGLSQAVCSALCAALLASGKTPVLYWENPAAGAVYRKLGFRAVGLWRSVWLEKFAE
jgi:predicted GNAT family acetyltransferase